MHLHSKVVIEKLESSGWKEGRNVPIAFETPPNLILFPKAREVLVEFGGLHFGECEAGIDRATSDVNIDPTLGFYLAGELQKYEKLTGTKLFPLGEVQRGHCYLIIDDVGAIYLLTDVFEKLANNFNDGIELLLLGKKAG